MKKIPILTVIFFSCLCRAQVKQGKIVYDRMTKMKTKQFIGTSAVSTGADFIRQTYELTFSNNKSIWEELPTIRNEQGSGESGDVAPLSVTVGSIKESSGDNTIYFDYDNHFSVTKRELNSKNYLIKDSIEDLVWQLSNESKNILGFTVHRATALRKIKYDVTIMTNGILQKQERTDTMKVGAWYTPEIIFSGGPEVSGLPGLILGLDIDDGVVVYMAESFTDKINPKKIKEPTGGRPIAAKDFRIEMEKLYQH